MREFTYFLPGQSEWGMYFFIFFFLSFFLSNLDFAHLQCFEYNPIVQSLKRRCKKTLTLLGKTKMKTKKKKKERKKNKKRERERRKEMEKKNESENVVSLSTKRVEW
eukprot:Rmarinus@m.21982